MTARFPVSECTNNAHGIQSYRQYKHGDAMRCLLALPQLFMVIQWFVVSVRIFARRDVVIYACGKWNRLTLTPILHHRGQKSHPLC